LGLYGAVVARPDFPRTIMAFQERFASEAACLEYLAASRWPEGFVCPVCGGGRAWVLGRRHLWECAGCGVQTSVTAGTVMHRTRTPLRVWFWAAYLVATHHPGISAKQLQRQLGLSRYETAWLMLQKLRRAMVAPEREPLKGEVEVDECYLGGHDPWTDGRELGKKRLVGVAIEVRGRASGRLRLGTLSAASGKWLGEFVQATVAPGAVVHTDGFSGYNGLGGLGYDHRPRSQRAAPAGEWLLPRAHRAVSNLKAWLHGTHRGVGAPHLQVYLDEYVFRHNRRRTPMAAFQTLLGLSSLHKPTTYDQITRRDKATA
jgi:transposase-like protein